MDNILRLYNVYSTIISLYIYLFIKNQNELSVRTSLQCTETLCTETLSVFLEDEATLFNGGTPYRYASIVTALTI